MMWVLSMLLLFEVMVCSFKFPKCDLYSDKRGSWVTTPDHSPNKSNIRYLEVEEHFIGDSGPGEALYFDQLWIPHNCSYHRFTNHTLHKCVKYLLKEKEEFGSIEHVEKQRIRIMFLGDSTTRAIFCGITRIIAGSEVYGPCQNIVCPSNNDVGVGKTVEFFDGLLEMTFVYVHTYDYPRVDWIIYDMAVTSADKPFAIIMNTGAWSFDGIARQHMGVEAKEYCDDNDNTTLEYSQIARGRASVEFNKSMWELGEAAHEAGVRLIYRNNHYNTRFGAHCADDRIEAALKGSRWEIWDNREMSRDVWREQTFDGLHFDRGSIHTYEEHVELVQTKIYNSIFWGFKHWPSAGQLEMQLSQSLLQSLFHDCLMGSVPNKLLF